MHRRSTLFSAVDTFPTFVPHGGIEQTLSIGYRLLVLPFPRHLGVLVEGVWLDSSTGTLTPLAALLGTVGDLHLCHGQPRQAGQEEAPHQQLHPERTF